MAAGTEPAAPAPGVRILLAEDNPINQRLAVLQIERLGYAVTAVADGRAAVDALVEDPDAFDLILMDCQMPIMDGFEAARVIRRAEPADRRVPIVAMTANAMRGDREACLAAGMDAYLSKPVRPAELEEALRFWLALPSTEAPKSTAAIALPRFAAIRAKCGADTLDEALVADLFETAGAGSAAIVNDLIEAFVTGAEARIIAMRAAIAQDDRAALVSAAHNLTGSSGSYGASRLSRLARELETAASRANPGAAGELLTQLEAEFERVKFAFALLKLPWEA
jgi:two-component system, sensor histidine kinase and response regulator